MARGDISSSPGRGKRVDRLEYEIVQIDGFEPIRLQIDVFMKKRFGSSDTSPRPVTGASFILAAEGESVEGTDIDACITAIRCKLDKRFAIKWRPWLKVSVEPVSTYRAEGGAGLSLRWDRVERGRAFDGTELMRSLVLHEDRTWKVEPWPQYFKDRSGATLACIPETDENLEALSTFAAKIAEMRKALAKFVSPERIDDTLRAIASGEIKLIPGRHA
jgi:hypothetical protein